MDDIQYKVLLEMNSKIDQLLAVKEALDRHMEADEKLFMGNGSPGLIKQVDRLTQAYKMTWGMLVMVVSLVVDKLWHLVVK